MEVMSATKMNTAPGMDELSYTNWKKFDVGSFVLCAMFNKCIELGLVPTSWKETKTVLVLRRSNNENNNNDLTKWRPITLINTATRLLSSCVASRVKRWLIEKNVLAPEQKGLKHVEGWVENNFVLQSILQDTKRKSEDAAIAWLYLKNVDGNLLNRTLLKKLAEMRLHPKNIEIIRQLYCEATTRYSTSAGVSRESPISGVMLDCQLSRWLFCLAINDTITEVASLQLGYELFSSSYSILAYVYDVEVVSDNPVNLQKMLERLNEKSKNLGLEIDVSRSTAIHIENGKYCHSHQDIFNIQGNIISLQTEESYTKYLYFCRIITDYKPFDNVDQALTELDYDLEEVNTSELEPWQKFQALHKFLMPRIDLLSKSGPLAIKYFKRFHDKMEKYARTWANLDEAGKDLLYVPQQNGGFDLTPVKLKPQISTIVLAHKFLQNQDGFQAVAQMSLNEAVQNKCKRSSIESTDLINYLNGDMTGLGKATDTSSLWSRIRIYIVHLNKKIKMLKWEGSLESQVLTLNGERLDLESAESKITKAIQDWYFESLKSRENKGKIIGCARGPISNHFIKSGSFMDKDDWSFIFRARLDTLPSPRGARQCKTCDGTLAHILECPQNHHKFDLLKNRIVSKIKTAMPKNPNSEKLGEKMKFAETPPDILILDDDKRSALVVNVILAFERDKEALEEARKMNVENCKHQAERLESEGFEVCLEVIVIGKLGSFVELNSAIFEKMKIPGNRADRISKKIVSDVIKESRIIYNDHLSGRDSG